MSGQRGHWLLLAAVLVAAVTLVPSVAGQGTVPVIPTHPHLILASDYADLPAPKAQLLFGSPLPQVEILPTANTSLGATLGLVYVLEIAPNGSSAAHPLVVREAAPQTLQQFNGTISLHGASSYVNLVATLPVFPTQSSLWTNGTGIPPVTNVSKQAILDVNYSEATGSDGSPGVQLSWAVSGWPWAKPSGDELALEYIVQVVSGSGFQTCSSVPSTNAPGAACASQPLTTGEAVWGSSMTALKGTGPAGSVAWVSWNPQVSGPHDESTTVSAGAYLVKPGTSALAIAAPDDGAQAVSGTTLFLLAPGPVVGITPPLAGDLPVYGGAALIFAAVASVGILASRRRDRAIARELSA